MENEILPNVLGDDTSSKIRTRSAKTTSELRSSSVSSDSYEKQTKLYTGTKLVGYTNLHKSNYIPVFDTCSDTRSKIQDITRMRRS